MKTAKEVGDWLIENRDAVNLFLKALHTASDNDTYDKIETTALTEVYSYGFQTISSYVEQPNSFFKQVIVLT